MTKSVHRRVKLDISGVGRSALYVSVEVGGTLEANNCPALDRGLYSRVAKSPGTRYVAVAASLGRTFRGVIIYSCDMQFSKSLTHCVFCTASVLVVADGALKKNLLHSSSINNCRLRLSLNAKKNVPR